MLAAAGAGIPAIGICATRRRLWLPTTGPTRRHLRIAISSRGTCLPPCRAQVLASWTDMGCPGGTGGAAHLPLGRCPGLARCLRPGRKTGVGSESRSVRLQLPYRSGRVWRGMIGLARAGYAALSNAAVGPPCGPGLMMTGQAATQAFERAVRPCGVSQFRPDNGTRPPRPRSPS